MAPLRPTLYMYIIRVHHKPLSVHACPEGWSIVTFLSVYEIYDLIFNYSNMGEVENIAL